MMEKIAFNGQHHVQHYFI